MANPVDLRPDYSRLACQCFRTHEENALLGQVLIKIGGIALSVFGTMIAARIGIVAGYTLGLASYAVDLWSQRDCNKYPICITIATAVAYKQNLLFGYGAGLAAAYSIRIFAARILRLYDERRNQELNELGKSLLSPEFQIYLKGKHINPSVDNQIINEGEELLTSASQNVRMVEDTSRYLEKIKEILPHHRQFLNVNPYGLLTLQNENTKRALVKEEFFHLSSFYETKFQQEGRLTHTLLELAFAIAGIATSILTRSAIGFGIALTAFPLQYGYDRQRNQRSRQIATALQTPAFQAFISDLKKHTGISIIFIQRNLGQIYDNYLKSISQQRQVVESADRQSEVQSAPPPLESSPDDGNRPSWCGAG